MNTLNRFDKLTENVIILFNEFSKILLKAEERINHKKTKHYTAIAMTIYRYPTSAFTHSY